MAKRRKGGPASRRQHGRAPSGPTLVTTEGDPVVFCTASYRHTGMDEVAQILAEVDDFDLAAHPEPEPDGTVQFGWYEVGPSKRPLPDPMSRRVLAGLMLGPETLKIDTMSESRLARCRRRLEDLLGDRLHLLRTTAKSVEQARAEGLPHEPPEPVILPSETVAKMKEQMLRQWIDSSVPALDGMTPREAVRTPEGRQMVLDLLDYIERQYARNPRPPGVLSADPREAKRRLGLE